jgi:4'-phosphopantetheinyl transferase
VSAEKWRSILSEAEWERAMRFRMPADQTRFAVTRGILRTLLSPYLSVPAAAIEFTANEYGKPAILAAQNVASIHFNVSHSGDYSLLAFAKEIDVGVDVERISGKRVVSDLAQRVLSPAEYRRFNMLAGGDRERTFFQIWTLKESVLKGIGSGLSVAPECIEVLFHPDEPRLLTCSAQQIPDVTEWTLRTLPIGDDAYRAAIAVRHKMPAIEVNRFDMARMYDE